MINLEGKTDILRKSLIKDGKYLIAKIFGERQEAGERKILDVYFRYKDYIAPDENPDWFSASLEDVWSSKFLGLNDDFWNLPINKAKKLEHQNPPYCAAFRLSGRRGDPRKYSKVFTVQMAGCNFDCLYCYVPYHLKTANPEFGRYFSAKEIVDEFLKVKEQRKDEEWNVLRISGGEPLTIIPELVIDIQNEIERRSPETYIWVDTNLSTVKYIKSFERELKKTLLSRNLGLVGCFKAVDENDFSILTGVDKSFFKNQFEVAKILVKWGVDIYLYLPALIYGRNMEGRMENFIERLREIHRNLPLRLEVLSINYYPPTKININEKEKEGRFITKVDQRTFFEVWYRQLLPKMYSEEELEKFCCEISLL